MVRLVLTLALTSSALAAAVPSDALAATASTQSPRPSVQPPSRRHGATVAGIVMAAEARSRPGGGADVWMVGTQTTWSGEPQQLLVLASAWYRGSEWLRVLLPIRPNETTGWIPRNNVVLLHTKYWITVDKVDRTVDIYRRGREVQSYEAVIGQATTPTPDGLAAIYERDPQPDPSGFLGPWALPLTIFSNVLFNFGGGPGRVAIHGRDGASLLDPLGSAESHGCIRIDDYAIDWMAANIPPGTPVEITG